MESVKSIVKDVVYGKSKIHTNMEFTFSNNICRQWGIFSLDISSEYIDNYIVMRHQQRKDRGYLHG